MIRALIIDDEQLAREELALMLEETGQFDLVGSCANALEGLKAIRELRPELIFLDIEMPSVDGFEMLGMLDDDLTPHVVFVTAFDQHALRAFEERALDYLVKPVDPQRLQKTLAKIRSNMLRGVLPHYPAAPLDRIPCQVCNRIKLVPPDEVLFVRSDPCGIYLVTAEGEFFTELTLKTMEKRTLLVRCQKQYLVNLRRVSELIRLDHGQAELRLTNGDRIPVSRRYLRQVKEHLGI